MTFEVVTFEVLAPSCGQVQCHSTTTWTQGLAFDTLDASRVSLNDPEVRGNRILDVISDNSEERMPPDVPLPQLDVDLLTAWIQAGRPGL